MTAVRIDVEERSPEWYEARRHGVTASEIPVILGLSPYSSPFELYWRKKGVLPEEEDDKRKARGRKLERFIVEWFAEEHPELWVRPGGLYRHGQRSWQMATPDAEAFEMPPEEYERLGGLHGGRIAVVQAKTAARRDDWGDEGTDDIPVHYHAQVLWEMDVMEVAVAYVPVLFGLDYREYVVERNEEELEVMRNEALNFLERFQRDDPPDLDWRPATTRALKRLHPSVEDTDVALDEHADWVTHYQRAREHIRELEKAKAEAENHIRAALGDAARGIVNGRKVVSRSVYDLKERTLPATTVNRLTVSKPKENE